MKIIKLSSALSEQEIMNKTKKFNVLVVSPKVVRSQDQIKLALFLAKKSFSNKTNIAKTFELEFLLWLFGERNISTALKKNKFSSENFIAIIRDTDLAKKTILRELCAKQKPFLLRRRASALELERISLSRSN